MFDAWRKIKPLRHWLRKKQTGWKKIRTLGGFQVFKVIRLEEEKVIAEFRQQLIKVAFEKALTGIKSRMSPSLHRKYIAFQIVLLSW